jgi:hypothetical protein
VTPLVEVAPAQLVTVTGLQSLADAPLVTAVAVAFTIWPLARVTDGLKEETFIVQEVPDVVVVPLPMSVIPSL